MAFSMNSNSSFLKSICIVVAISLSSTLLQLQSVDAFPKLGRFGVNNIQLRNKNKGKNGFIGHENILNVRGGSSSDSSSSSSSSTHTTIGTTSSGGSKKRKSANSKNKNGKKEVTTWKEPLNYNQTAVQIGSDNISNLLDNLQTNPSTGLTDIEAKKRLDMYGKNKLKAPPGKSLFQLTVEQFDDKLVQILLAVALLSGVFSYYEMLEHIAETGEKQGILKSFVEPIVIVAILVLNAIVGVWQGKSAEGSLEALKKLQPSLATVLRNGKWIDNINASELVPGDIIKFRVGDKISADARVLSLESSTLSIDEGSLTGESVTVQKLPGDEGVCDVDAPVQDMQSVVFSGTVCTAGSATALVIRTGMSTEMGKIQKGVTEAKSEEHKTPLGIKLDEFGEQLTKIIGIICVAVWLVSIPKWGDNTFSNPWKGAIYYAKVAVALGVAAIPEGLPAVITLCLSLGTRRMARKNGTSIQFFA